MKTLTEIDREIQAAEDALEQLRRNRMILERAERELSPAQKLAIGLHDALCRHNHTDGCGWFYEVKDGIHQTWSPSSTHGHWLDRAQRMTGFCCQNGMTTETAVAFLKFVEKGM